MTITGTDIDGTYTSNDGQFSRLLFTLLGPVELNSELVG